MEDKESNFFFFFFFSFQVKEEFLVCAHLNTLTRKKLFYMLILRGKSPVSWEREEKEGEGKGKENE